MIHQASHVCFKRVSLPPQQSLPAFAFSASSVVPTQQMVSGGFSIGNGHQKPPGVGGSRYLLSIDIPCFAKSLDLSKRSPITITHSSGPSPEKSTQRHRSRVSPSPLPKAKASRRVAHHSSAPREPRRRRHFWNAWPGHENAQVTSKQPTKQLNNKSTRTSQMKPKQVLHAAKPSAGGLRQDLNGNHASST